jgi:hypothetical protein
MARGRTIETLVSGLLAALIAVTTAIGVPAASTLAAPAASEDVCPEPNSTFESTCYLGRDADVLGFLAADGDVAIYRVEPLEFGVTLHAILGQQPFPYRMTLLNWRAEIVAQSEPGAPSLDALLGPPGSYYIAVEQGFAGQVSPTEPYHLAAQFDYVGPVPEVRYSATFRPGGVEEEDYDTSSDDDADYVIEHGKLTVKMKHGGDPDDPEYTGYWLPTGGAVQDFTLSMDVNMLNQSYSGYSIKFRSPEDADDQTGYELAVSPTQHALRVRLSDFENDRFKDFTGRITSDAILATGPNRIVVRCQGDTIVVNVNGAELARIQDGSFSDGLISFVVVAWADEPPAVAFSNILVTTP